MSRQAVIDKSMASVREAMADGASVMIGGSGTSGMPDELIEALIDRSFGLLGIGSEGASVGEMIDGLTLDALQGLTGVPLRMAVPAG
ncbi:CoA-transferase [Novosphingobium sp.]|uniref:CoA-transferase n=1 Tax=Novosphingobium sp. TaxID=1874826 RepID=UPI00352A01B9